MTLRLHDTLTRQLVPVEPLQPAHVRLYTCGPTVWNWVHIGNFRTFIFEDVLRRWLDHRFDRVTHVMNLTDVDDRIIKNARDHGNDLEAETAQWIRAFNEDRETLGVRPAHYYPRATEYVEQMVELVERLLETGAAYESDGSYYFRIAAFPSYGQLSGVKSEGLVAGASGRVDTDDYQKEEVRDFALWKTVGSEEIGWDTRIGRGRPGWHIECSAMSMTLLGESFDIHCGGVDNIFPHHENEIAQSEAATGKPFVRIWCHSEHLQVVGEKMAKRTRNFKTVREVLAEGARASALRYVLAASTHYRKPLNYSDEPLAAATEAVERLATFRQRVEELQPASGDTGSGDEEALASIRSARSGFGDAMDDDLNLPEAMGAVFTALRDLNRILDTSSIGSETHRALRAMLHEVDDVLGVFPLVDRERASQFEVTEDEKELLVARQKARDEKRWADADAIRDELGRRGIQVDDTSDGQRWRRS